MSNQLFTVRNEFNATQAQMAMFMGVPLRTYEDLEAGRAKIRTIHTRALDRAIMEMARHNDCADKLPLDLKKLIKDLAAKLPE